MNGSMWVVLEKAIRLQNIKNKIIDYSTISDQ